MPSDSQWLLQADAAKLLRVSLRTLQYLRRDGKIKAEQRDGRLRYDPESLQEYIDGQPFRGGETVVPTSSSIALQEMVELVRVLVTNFDSFGKMVLEPHKMLIEQCRQQTEALRERCSDLETRHIAMLDKWEELTSLQQERQLEAERQKANIEMRAEMLKLFGPKLDTLFKGATIKKPLVDWVASIDVVELKAMQDLGILNDEQVAEFLAIKAKSKRVQNGVNSSSETGEVEK